MIWWAKVTFEYALPFYGERRPILIDLVKNWNAEYEKKYLSVKKDGKNLFPNPTTQVGRKRIIPALTAGLIYDAVRRGRPVPSSRCVISPKKRKPTILSAKVKSD